MKEARKHVLSVVVTLKGNNFSYEIERTIVTEEKYDGDIVKALHNDIMNSTSEEFTFREDSDGTLGLNKFVNNEKQRVQLCAFNKDEIGSIEINYLREYRGDLVEVFTDNPRGYQLKLLPEKQNWIARLFKKPLVE